MLQGIIPDGLSTTHTTIDTANSVRGFYGYNTFLIKGSELSKGAQFGEILRQNTDIDPTNLALYDVPVNWMRMYLQNNIIPWKDNTTGGASAQFGLSLATMFDFRSNLVAPGQVTITSNMHPQPDWISPRGVYENWLGTDPWNADPMNQQWAHGLTQSDFIAYNKYPVDLPSLRPLTGSNAIGTATSLQGVLANYPPLFNPPDDNMSPFARRTDLTVMGAYDNPTGPTLTSITVTPSTINLRFPATQAVTATCNLSDSTSYDCTSTVTWSTGGSPYFAVSGSTVASSNNAGSGTLTATLSGVTGTASVTVTVPAPNKVYLGPGVCVGCGTGTAKVSISR